MLSSHELQGMKAPEPKVYLYRRIVQAKLFIDKHYASAIHLDHIADEAFFSKFHFVRLFKFIYNKTPHHYLTTVRIAKAKLLLAENKPVNEVCFAVGFESISSFTALFKKSTGVAPSVYQKNYLRRQQDMRANPLQFIPNCFAQSKGWTKNSNIQEV